MTYQVQFLRELKIRGFHEIAMKQAKSKQQQEPTFRTADHFKGQTFSPQKFQQSKKGGFNPSTFKTQHKG